MSILAVRLSDQDKNALAGYARFHGKSISAMAREILIEKIEDEEDIRDYIEYKKSPDHKTYTHEEMGEKLGL
jgi:plasmid stability protein